MLYITYVESGRPLPSKDAEWRVGEPVPDIDWKDVRELSANGNELAYIEKVTGSRMFDKDVVHYVGWLAQQIFVNL